MTREETIKWLESLKAEIGKSEHRILWHYAEAIDMAIEALSEDISEDGTLNVNVSDASKVKRVMVWGEESGGLYYPDRPKGEWVKDECKDGEQWYRCSNCGERYVLIETRGQSLDVAFPFCPQCTADMRGEEECQQETMK